MFALSLVTLQVEFANAADSGGSPAKEGCLAAGYAWDDQQGCASKPCHTVFLGDGPPGEVPVNAFGQWQFCDGWTGQWILLGTVTRASSGPAAPSSATTASH